MEGMEETGHGEAHCTIYCSDYIQCGIIQGFKLWATRGRKSIGMDIWFLDEFGFLSGEAPRSRSDLCTSVRMESQEEQRPEVVCRGQGGIKNRPWI